MCPDPTLKVLPIVCCWCEIFRPNSQLCADPDESSDLTVKVLPMSRVLTPHWNRCRCPVADVKCSDLPFKVLPIPTLTGLLIIDFQSVAHVKCPDLRLKGLPILTSTVLPVSIVAQADHCLCQLFWPDIESVADVVLLLWNVPTQCSKYWPDIDSCLTLETLWLPASTIFSMSGQNTSYLQHLHYWDRQEDECWVRIVDLDNTFSPGIGNT